MPSTRPSPHSFSPPSFASSPFSLFVAHLSYLTVPALVLGSVLVVAGSKHYAAVKDLQQQQQQQPETGPDRRHRRSTSSATRTLMETLNNMAAATAKVVWGDAQIVQKPGTAEPVSGKTGDVSKGEPYDAGNIEPQPSPYRETNGAVETPATETPAATEDSAAAVGPATTTPIISTKNAAELQPTATPAHQPVTTPAAAPEAVTPPAPDHPAATHSSSATPGDSTAAQNDVRAPDDPATNPEDPATRAKQDVDNSATGLDDSVSPDKLSEPGPKPVAELAKERGGDAGHVNVGGANDDNSSSNNNMHQQQQEAGGDDGPLKEGSDEGTGEKWIKTTGLQVDGGNFDAAGAGAGREADRLLGDKGVHHKADGATHDPADSADRRSNSSGGSREKPKLLDRIKAKLPHHHHKKQEV